MDLKGTVAVITGGASGIGRGTALAMARAGVDIVLADINESRAASTKAEVEALGRRACAVKCDVTRDADIERLAAVSIQEMGHVDIMMNNAGSVVRGAVEEISVADWQWQFDVNVFGVVRGIRAFLPHMPGRGSGYIINTASIAGLVALTGEGAPYVASKFAVVGLSESLALYCRPRGIGVAVLCPGSVNTNLHETGRSIAMTPERELSETKQAARFQGDREKQPEEIGELVVDSVRNDRFFILAEMIHHDTLVKRTQDLNAFLESRLSEFAS